MHISEQDYLMHYGVKGMKWGVRKERERSGDSRLVRGLIKMGKASAKSKTLTKMGSKIAKANQERAKFKKMVKDERDLKRSLKAATTQAEKVKITKKWVSSTYYGRQLDKITNAYRGKGSRHG